MSDELRTRPVDRLFDAWWLDALLVLSVFLAVTLFPVISDRVDLLGRLTLERRLDAYTDLITIAALLGGFSSLAFTTYLGWSSRGIRRVKSKIGLRLLVVWLSCIATPWVCALLIWFAKILDEGPVASENDARWLALAALVLLLISLLRSLIIFVDLAKYNDEDPQQNFPQTSASLAVPAHRLPSAEQSSE